MRNKAKVTLVVAIVLGLVVLPALAGEDGKIQEKRYVTAQGIAGTCLVQEDLSIGNACFHLKASSTDLAIEIDDDYFDIVYGNYRFFDGPWDTSDPPEFIAGGNFCSTAEVEIPKDARFVIVFVDGHVGTPVQCDDGVGQGASIGTILIEEWITENLTTMN